LRRDHGFARRPIGGQGGSANLSPYYNTTNVNRPVLSRTLPLGDLRARYDAHYRTVLQEVLNWNYIGGLVTKYQKMIATDVAQRGLDRLDGERIGLGAHPQLTGRSSSGAGGLGHQLAVAPGHPGLEDPEHHDQQQVGHDGELDQRRAALG